MSLKKNKCGYLIKNIRIFDFTSYSDNGFIHFEDEVIHRDIMENLSHYLKSKDYISKISNSEIKVIDGKGQLMLPNFVAGHTHIYSTFSRGMSVPFNPHSFQDILDQLWWKLDEALTLDHVYLSGLASGIDFVKSGVTTLIDHHASGEIKASLDTLYQGVSKDIGIRAGYCFETSDRYNIDDCLKENIHFMNSCIKEKRQDGFGLFGLHASMSLSDETLIKVKEVVGDQPIHIHVAESLEDQTHCINHYGMRIVERLEKFGLLNKDSILAHCIYIDEKEALLIKQSACLVAMNVTSNMNNSVGLANYKLLKKHSIPVMIGNDGMTSDIASEWRNTVFAMHHETKSPIGFGLDDLQTMIATSYDYVSRRLGIRLGKLEAGYKSDLMLVDYSPRTPINRDNVLGHLLYGIFHNFRPKDLWCDGKYLLNNYEFIGENKIKIEKQLQEAPVLVEKLWNRLES